MIVHDGVSHVFRVHASPLVGSLVGLLQARFGLVMKERAQAQMRDATERYFTLKRLLKRETRLVFMRDGESECGRIFAWGDGASCVRGIEVVRQGCACCGRNIAFRELGRHRTREHDRLCLGQRGDRERDRLDTRLRMRLGRDEETECRERACPPLSGHTQARLRAMDAPERPQAPRAYACPSASPAVCLRRW